MLTSDFAVSASRGRCTTNGDKVPGIRERYDDLARSPTLAADAIVRRGIRRGELSPTTSVTVLLDALCGGAMMHAMALPDVQGKVTAGAAGYARQLVDFVLGSASAAARTDEAAG